MLLDQIQQAVLGAEVVIHPGERHASGAGKVAHGSAGVSFFAKDFDGMFQNLAQLAVETRLGRLMPHRSMGARSGD